MFCPYHWPYGVKLFSRSINIQRVWKDYQEVIHNTYHGEHIKTNHHVICSMPEDMAKQFELSIFATPVLETVREFLENETTTRDKFPLNLLGMTKGKPRCASMMMKTGMEVSQYYTVFSYGPPMLKSPFRAS